MILDVENRKRHYVLVSIVLLYAPFVTASGRILDLTSETTAIIGLLSCAFIGFLLRRASSEKYSKFIPYTNVYLFVFCFLMAFSCLLAQLDGVRSDEMAMWRQLFMGLLPIFLYFGCYRLSQVVNVSRGIEIGLAGIAIISFFSIGLEFIGLTDFEHYGHRYFGFLSDGSAWLVSFVCVVLFVQSRLLLLGVMLAVLILTLSRGAMLVFLVSVILIVVVGRGEFYKHRRKIILVSLSLIGFALLFGYDQLNSFISRSENTNIWENDRLWTSRLSLNVFYESPIFGSGYNSHQYFYPKEELARLGVLGHSTPTSTAMQVLADGGLVTFIAYALFAFKVTILSWHVLAHEILSKDFAVLRGLAAWLISFMWVNQFAAWLLPGSYLAPIFFSVTGVVVGSVSRYR